MVTLSGAFSAQAALVSLQRTPYDRQLERVQHVLDRDACENNGKPGDIDTINQAMGDAYRLPYTSYAKWQSPEETNKNKRADCKARAVLLYHKLNEVGIGSHRLVIGRLKGGNSETHTWLVWKTKEAEYLLDPTYYRKAISMDKVSKGKYLPEFIYCGGGKYGYVPNAVVYEGLGDIPQYLKDRSKKTRIFLAEEEQKNSPAQASKENLSSSGFTESRKTLIDTSNRKPLKEVQSKVPVQKTLKDIEPQTTTDDPSLASLR